MTLEQVKADIKSGKSKRIYYSAGTLWWTHLESDVEEASKQGKIYQIEVNKRMLADETVPEEKKQRLKALLSQIDTSKAGIPLDPVGAPLYAMDKPMKWIEQSEKKPSHFGKHGLAAFIFTHHQNCKTGFYNKWDKYNELIDNNGNVSK